MHRRRSLARLVGLALAAVGCAGCSPPSDGAPVDSEVATTPTPDLNPQGFFRSMTDDPEE